MTRMGARVAVGRRNLFSERRRGPLGVAGTAAALLASTTMIVLDVPSVISAIRTMALRGKAPS